MTDNSNVPDKPEAPAGGNGGNGDNAGGSGGATPARQQPEPQSEVLSLSQLIGGPIHALVDAEAQSAMATARLMYLTSSASRTCSWPVASDSSVSRRDIVLRRRCA